MKKEMILTVVIATAFLIGCSQKPKEESMLDADKILENQVIAPTPVAGVQQPMVEGQQPIAMDNTATMEQAAEPMAAVAEVTTPTAMDIQQALKNAEFYNGKVDGDIGPRTKKAIREFQAKNDLAADGKVGRKTWAKLAPYLNQAPEPTTTTDISN